MSEELKPDCGCVAIQGENSGFDPYVKGGKDSSKCLFPDLEVALRSQIEISNELRSNLNKTEKTLAAALARAEALEKELVELNATFDLQWKADMRAIAIWRAEKPDERELKQPDRAEMVLWLLRERDALQKRVEKLEGECNSCIEAEEKIKELELRIRELEGVGEFNND